MSNNLIDWYDGIMECHAHVHSMHNFVPVSFTKSQWMEQATTLMCSHCLQIVNMEKVFELNALVNSDNVQTSSANLSETSDNA